MIDFDKDIFRRSYDELHRALADAGAAFKGRTVFVCPFHEDGSPSGSIYEKGGAYHFKCHGCNAGGDVFDAIALHTKRPVEDVLKDFARQHAGTRPGTQTPAPCPKPPKVHPDLESLKSAALWATKDRGGIEVERVYPYTSPARWTPDVKGEEAVARIADLIVLRIRVEKNGKTDKTFLQATPVEGGFILKKPEGPAPLYNRLRVQRAHGVLVVEGEKACEVVQAVMGGTMAATTAPGGAKNGEHADWSPLSGKTVYLWPDHDAVDPKTGKRSGEEHMRTVARKLQELAEPPAGIFWIDPETIGVEEDGSDVVDFIAQYGGDTAEGKRDVLAEALKQAKPLDAAGELDQLIEEEIAGLHKTIPFPWASMTRLAKALRPGTVSMVCGDPGSGKSLWVLEALCWWTKNSVKCAAYELEEDRAYHLKRALAQLAEVADLTDAEWVQAHPNDARAHLSLHRHTIDGLARCIDDAPEAQLTYRQILAWIEARAQAGCRVVIVDPVTAAATSDRPWVDDLQFLIAAKAIVRKYRCSLVLVTHPRKGRKMPGASGMDELAGGAAFPRFCQSIFWLVRPESPRRVRCAGIGEHGSFETTINRSVRIVKARNGAGAGMEIGFNFEAGSLRFAEQGIVEDDVDTKATAPRPAWPGAPRFSVPQPPPNLDDIPV